MDPALALAETLPSHTDPRKVIDYAKAADEKLFAALASVRQLARHRTPDSEPRKRPIDTADASLIADF